MASSARPARAGAPRWRSSTLRIANTQRLLEAEATGLEAKAEALKKYNDAATFLELAKLRIEAERDVHIDQAKAMGSALSQAQIRMYGGGDGTHGHHPRPVHARASASARSSKASRNRCPRGCGSGSAPTASRACSAGRTTAAR